MARSSDPLTEDEIWGTWEELLLACAVNRHGTLSWDSVSAEVRSRSPYAHLLTADNCRHRYRLLKRRFSSAGDGIDGVDEEEPAVEIPWLDELRKLRVAELRREVQRYDVSIGSLQLKVKRLKEERERSSRPPEAGDAVNGTEPGSGSGTDLKEKDKKHKDRGEHPRCKPENGAAERVSGEDSGRSSKESNSAEPKAVEAEEVKVEERIKEEPDPAVDGSRSDPVAGAEASSFNGSSDTIAKGAVRSPAAEPNPALNESGDSVAVSKGGEDEEGTKESSDVQSSASLSRRRCVRRRRAAAAALTVAEPGAEASSPVRKVINAESQPLIAFLETIRSSKYGSVFARRLESQENVRYRSMIRRHVDLEMVRNRIRRKGYTSAEFFRDLLLLCNNGLVFYPKSSPESIAAVHLRDLINKEIAATLRKNRQASSQSATELTPPPAAAAPPAERPPPPLPPPLPPKPKSDPDGASEKSATLPPLVACRKRSSFLGKPAKVAKKAERVDKDVKKERVEKKKLKTEDESEDDDEKEDVEEKEKEEVIVDMKSTKQRTAISRGLRTNKARGSGGSRGGGDALVKNPKPEPAEQEAKSGGGSTAKKRSAADFLSRMKSSSPSSNGKTVDSLKGSSSTRRGGGDQQEKKKVKESAAAAGKRSVGRPPKRGVAMPAPPAKRTREITPPPLPKKRGRK